MIGKIFLLLLPVSAVLGVYTPTIPTPVGDLILFRLLILVGVATILLLNYRIRWHRSLFKLFVVLFAVFWSIYGALSLLWTPDVIIGLHGVLSVFLWLCLIVVLFSMRVEENRQEIYLFRGWIVAYIICVGFAVWELTTGHHLQGGPYVENTPLVVLRYTVIGTLLNPNNFAGTIVLAWPFIFVAFGRMSPSWWKKTLRATIVLSAPLLVLAAQGRLALIALMVQVFILALLNVRRPKRFALISLGVGVGVIIGLSWLQQNSYMLTRLANLWEEGLGAGSVHTRINMLLNALSMIYHTAGFGVGAGGYNQTMLMGTHFLPTNGNPNPHNFWMQLGAEYGIFVLTGFIALYVALVVRALRLRKAAKRAGEKPLLRHADCALLILAGYALVCAENSSFMLQPVNWMILATLIVMLGHKQAGRRRYRIRRQDSARREALAGQ